MTKREFYEKVAAGEMNDEMQTFATDELAKMAEAAEKRKGKVSEAEQAKRDANAALVERVVNEVLGTEAMTATDVGAKLTELTGEEYSVQKVSALCRAAVNAGKANAEEVKVPGKGKLKGYTRA
jgi:hypothetical protein